MRLPLVTAIALALLGTSPAACVLAAAPAPTSAAASSITTQLPRTAKPTHYAVEITPL